jgi:hypothetical protein
VGGGRAQRKGEGRCIWWVYFVSIYENKRVEPVEIILRREKEEKRENNGGVDLIYI